MADDKDLRRNLRITLNRMAAIIDQYPDVGPLPDDLEREYQALKRTLDELLARGRAARAAAS